jgi:hypothetical protein
MSVLHSVCNCLEVDPVIVRLVLDQPVYLTPHDSAGSKRTESRPRGSCKRASKCQGAIDQEISSQQQPVLFFESQQSDDGKKSGRKRIKASYVQNPIHQVVTNHPGASRPSRSRLAGMQQ